MILQVDLEILSNSVMNELFIGIGFLESNKGSLFFIPIVIGIIFYSFYEDSKGKQ